MEYSTFPAHIKVYDGHSSFGHQSHRFMNTLDVRLFLDTTVIGHLTGAHTHTHRYRIKYMIKKNSNI